MKKLLSTVLVLALMLVLAVPTFATPIESLPNSNSSQDVTAQYAQAEAPVPDTVYHVTVAWAENNNSIKFTEGTAAYKWNGSAMKYEPDPDNNVADKWEGTAQYEVTVTNQSNGTINASAAWAASGGITAGATVGEAVTVTTAAVKEDGQAIDVTDTTTTGTAQNGSIVVDIHTPTAGTITNANTTIGTITVTITAG